MLTPREKIFAEGLIKYRKYQGKLTEKQSAGAWKLLRRVIMERDIPD